MKKIVIMMIVSCLMMLCSVGFAANESKDFAKQQVVAERFLDVFDAEPAPLFTQVSAGFNANLKKAITEKAFTDLQKQVKQKLGAMKEAKFYAYQRFDQADRVTYIGSFTKEKMVSIVFVFDRQNKMADFAFTPVQQPQAAKK